MSLSIKAQDPDLESQDGAPYSSTATSPGIPAASLSLSSSPLVPLSNFRAFPRFTSRMMRETPTLNNDAGNDAGRRGELRLERQLHRTNTGLSRPETRIPAEFRTLSVQVTETQHEREPRFQRTKTKTEKAKEDEKDITDISGLDWHSLPLDEVLRRLGVSSKSGLDCPMAARRLTKNGKNVITPPAKNWPKKIFFYFFGGFGSLLTGASVVCFLAWKPLGEPDPQASNLALAIVLLIVVCLQAIFNAWQDWSTNRTMASITGMLPSDVLVLRDGKTTKISTVELVQGDIVSIGRGSKVPADLRLIEVSPDLRFDKSILTGESVPVSATIDKTDDNFLETKNIALQGTLCTDGDAIGVCVGMGDHTVFGRIARAASGERPLRTSLEVEITRFVIIIASFAFIVASTIVILWAAWLRRDHPNFINTSALLIDCVSVAVAFIPEGLPFCVTLTLTAIARAMKKKDILCKSLATVESLGCVSVICSDKTGTLTQNKMSVVNVAIGAQVTTAEKVEKIGSDDSSIKKLCAIAAICNDAKFEEKNVGVPASNRKVHGDATDSGILRFSEQVVGVDSQRACIREVAKLPFNSKNKFALKVIEREPSGPDCSPIFENVQADSVVLVKGAPDILLARCNHFIASDATITPLDDSARAMITATQTDFASRGQRVLLLAMKNGPPAQSFSEKGMEVSPPSEESLLAMVSGLTAVGLVALLDPPRHDTKETVETCRRAGIRFLMVTGDFALTAQEIGRQCGIITNSSNNVKQLSDLPRDLPLDTISPYNSDAKEISSSLVLSGSDMSTMTESQWKRCLTFDEIIFARTSPRQKLQIVKRFQNAGCTVAVTGDGVNDSPALKQADVGVAIAGGSEVAMEAADLVLLNDFSAIVTGIESGRLCFENLRKSILYLLPAGSFSELCPVVVNVLFGLPQALSNIQMILICAVTDVLPALSLIYEKPESDLLLRKPRNRQKERLTDAKLICHAYLFLGILESLTAMTGAFYFGFHRHGVPFSSIWLKYGEYENPELVEKILPRAQSIYFFNLVIIQWFNLLSTRTRHLSIFQQEPLANPSTRNPRLFPAMLIALGLAVFFNYIPWFQHIFQTSEIDVEFYFLPIAYGLVILFVDECRKWINRRNLNGFLARIAW